MKVILFHGTCDATEYYDGDKYRSLSNSHWFPWMQKQLLVRDVEAHTPEVNKAYEPTYDKWLNELNRYDVDADTVLIGHSCGGGFLLRWLHENKQAQFKQMILVAPWVDPDREKTTDMFDVDFDFDGVDSSKVIIYSSTNDHSSIQSSIETIKSVLPESRVVVFKDYGHFCYGDMQTEEFPELLKEVIA